MVRKKIIIGLILASFLTMSFVQAASPAPTKTEDFSRLFKNKSDMDWSGGDQMCCFKAPNGKIYWCVDDTFLSQGKNADNSYLPGTARTF